MKTTHSFIPAITSVLIGFILLVLTVSSACSAAEISQTFDLHPGWNAIYLEVQPAPRTPADVFGEVPEIESVWTWMGGSSSVEFIQDPAEGLASQPGWRVYAASPDEAYLTDLYAIFANRTYLIKVKGPQMVSVTVSGRSIPDKISWITDSFNLLGFHLDPAVSPSFESYFAPSSAHRSQAVYRLSGQGKWTSIDNPSAAVMRSGEAYWIYCSGASKYQGPLAVEVNGNNLDFGKLLTTKTLTIKNLSSAAKAVRFEMLTPYPDIFTYKNVNTSTQRIDWLKLEAMPPLSVPANGTGYLTVAVRREQMSTSKTETLLGVYDDQGVRILIPMSVEK
ncbi:MAG: hypothetical protein HZB33_09425 [Nitrospirae bacterium]|nr:hypothetical protein [Nitrospirota bacterium]